MRAAPGMLPAAAAAAGLGALGAAGLELLGGRAGVLLAGALICLLAFTRWPYVILPAGIIGGTLAAGAVSGGKVSLIVAVHTGMLAAGCLALLACRVLLRTGSAGFRTAADTPMLAMAALVPLAAAYGLARGNPAHQVLVAAYEFAVIPAYFFLTTRTLGHPRALARAERCYLAGAMGLATAELTVPTRHGGLLSALALPPLLVAAGRARGWRLVGLAVLIAVSGLDTVLSAYRSIWLASGVALVVLLLRGTPQTRRAVAAAGLAGVAVLPLLLAASPGLQARAALIGQELRSSTGYRLPEAAVGLHVFTAHPLLGGGLGQVTPRVYLPDFKVTTVGPTYHVFYVMILANLGLSGLLLLLRPLARTVRHGLAARTDRATALAALTCGFLAAAAFAGPTDGHWELGLLPAATLLAIRAHAVPARPHPPHRELP